LIYTENTLRNVRNIAAAVASEVPILLQGTAGSGKSFLIREFAALLGQKESLVELHLDDSTDSKSLIGNYTCSDVPGTFVWQPGLITQAVLNGHWLVIEDVDAAPAEIMAALVPLVERRRLYLPNRMEEVTAHPRFRIFGTRTITSSTSTGRAFLSSWHTLQLSPLASEEIKSIMTQAYPQLLSTVIDRLLSVYDCMSVGAMRSHAAKTSVPAALLSPSLALTIRSILKISRRIASRVHFNRESLYITEKQNEDMLMEVLDVVVAKCRPESSSASIASDAAARSMCEMIASAWGGVSGEDIYRLWNNSNPQLTSHSVEVGRRLVSVGRISITCSEPTESDTASGGVFAHASQTLRLLERVAGAVDVSEPILLVGETGCGKTTCVQQLAHIMGKKLIVLNISLSTDVNELLGGFRPVTMRQMFMPSYETFLELFQETFSNAQNTAYLLAVSQIFKKQNWKKLLQSFKKAATDATSKFEKLAPKENNVTLSKRWAEFMKLVSRYEVNLARIENGFAFAFVEGLLVDAMRKGHWILLDEINLASPETLQGLTGILDGLSLCLTERGDIEPVQRDPEFRIFAAMNPPTDVGKRELSPSLRSRFTEIYVDEMLQESDLHDVVMGYLGEVSGGNAERVSSDVVTIYLKCRELSETVLVDTAGVRPRYSLRSLTRALKSALSYLAIGIKPLNRALYESFLLTFATLLDEEGKKHLASFFQSSLNLKADKQLSQPPTRPGGRSSEAAEWVLVKPFWLRAGATDPVDWAAPSTRNTKSYMSGSATEESTVPALKQKRFVLTPSVEENIRCLSAAVAAGVAPVLLQGPTSVGKTSMIEYLAARTGHKCVRINNHEHTDVQEYIGGYITNDQGRLVFNDGLLVQALRCGHWIILDELNLAPSDVLEALNRLLDDNKELLIPETGELVHPSPGFALFATQNPPGIYGGRKPLSRAFRNRFIEIHIGDLPLKEIEDIVHQVCGIPKKFSSLEVAVMNELQLMRQQSNLFQGKHGALTTRDLIKWGNRKPDSVLAVAIFGYMLLAEKLRNQTEKNVIIETLQNVCKVKLDLSHLYKRKSDVSSLPPGAIPTCIDECARLFGDCLGELDGVRDKLSAGEIEVKGVTGVAPTVTVQRMWLLINQCVNHSEAVLLVGETGSGKTTVCQLLAAHRGQDAHIVNCHQSTETADIIGGLRPVRNRDAIFRFTEDTVKQSMAELKVCIDGIQSSRDISLTSAGEGSPLKRARVEEPAAEESYFSRFDICMNNITNSWKRYKALFEWQDGPLVLAMKRGDMFVLDEINLADDAVIERLNSVLESGREITLAEKGGENGTETEKIVAHPNFRFMGTMNPGGDFGKRELSPALRSRFTELWVPAVQDRNDLVMIVREMLAQNIPNRLVELLAVCIVDFADWIEATATEMHLNTVKFSVREIVAWVKFISFWTLKARSEAYSDTTVNDDEHVFVSYVHGAQVLVLDGLGIGSSAISRSAVLDLKNLATNRLVDSCPEYVRATIRKSLSIEVDQAIETAGDMDVVQSSTLPFIQPEVVDDKFVLGYFSIPCGNTAPDVSKEMRSSYVLSARSTVLNMHRVLRALQLPRPILLEGAPGVGKTSLISSLAKLSGHKLVRINLSEHSEISDLLGTDLPKVKKFSDIDAETGETANGGNDNAMSFAWCDGIFLSALKRGDWVLLDELNLAPQSVLEGLNACFDHRGEIFLPEIGLSFKCPPSFRVFCAQNPVMEGGGRKGLPQSFLSRFSRVFVDPMSSEDMQAIAMTSFADSYDSVQSPNVAFLRSKIPQMIQMITGIQKDLDPVNSEAVEFARMGNPWEFNLRDVIRWCEIFVALSQKDLVSEALAESAAIANSFDEKDFEYVLSRSAHLLFVSRMRTQADREHMAEIYYKSFLLRLSIDLSPEVFLLPPEGGNRANGTTSIQFNRLFGEAALCFENIALCVNMKWPALLIGPPGAGKRRTIRYLAEITGNHLVEFSMTSSVDASDILGSFEQSNMERKLRRILRRLERVVLRVCSSVVREVALSQSQFKSSFSGTEQSVVISMVNSWRNISTLSREVFQHDLIRLDKGKELLQVIEHLISMLWESQELTMKHSVSELNPADAARKEVLGIREDLLLFVMDNNSVDSSSGFEWIDGILLEAMQLGQWLLFDNVNQCTPSVLDRLNSLLEPNGTILLTENGTGEVVKPHDNFRIFFVMDATNGGEISRAMRNRCVECYCPLSADIDLMLSDISSTSGSKSTDTQVLSSLVKSTPANDNDSTPSGSASPTSWIEGGQKKSVYRAYKKFYRILSVLQNCCSRVFSRADIYHMTAELMGPLINQRFAFERVREILHNASCDQPDADVSRRYDFPVSYLPWNNVFRTLPSIATAALQLIAVLDQCRSHTVPENGTEAIQIPLSIIYISDLTTPAMALATNFCARLSKENREIVKLLSSLSAPSKYTILAEPTYADDSMQYFCAVSFFIRVCSFILTTPTVDTVLEYISSGSFPYWHGSEFAREWVVAMIEYLRYSTNNENGVRGSYLSPASVSLRLPRNRIDDRNRSATESSASFALSLVDSFVVPRLRINFVESSQSSKLDTELMEQHSGKAGAIGLSLFLIGEAVDSGKLTSGDSKQIYLISSLYLVLKKCGGLIRSVWGLLCTEGINEDLLSRFVEACGVLTRRRDILSTIMLYHSCDLHNLKSSPIPLDKIVVAARWLKKSLAKTADFVDACDVVLGPQSTSTFKQAIVDLKIALSKFDRSIDMYWGYKNRLGLSARNGLLWKLGGHAAVPFLSAAWPTLVLLREIIGPVSAASLLKSFTDNENAGILVSVAENSALLSSRLMKRRLTFDTVRDWLGLYSTYYWSQTKELEEFGNMQRTTGHKNVDMHRLALQFSDLAESTWGNAERSPTDHELAEDHDPNVFTGHQFALIAQENEACGENFMTTIAEMHVFRCLHHVSNHLSLIILKNFARFDRKKPNSSEPRMSLRSAVESLKYLNRISSRTIEVAIRFTLFDPLHMRELQSLVWVLDSLVSDLERIKDFRKLSSKWAALENVARAYVVTLDTRIAAFFSRNVSNFMSSVDFSWMSPTLLTSLDLVPKTKKMQLDDSERESNAHIRNGSALLLRPMGLEAVLRMLAMMTVDTVTCFMDIFDSKLLVRDLDALSDRIVNDSDGSVQKLLLNLSFVFGRILTTIMKLDILAEYESANVLWTASLKPLLRFLAGPFIDSVNDDIVETAESDVMSYFSSAVSPADIGEAWVHLGCLRAHFVLSDAPVDPATISTVKATMLSKASEEHVGLVHAAMWAQGLTGGVTVSKNTANIAEIVRNDNAKIDNLLRRSIQRRESQADEVESGSNCIQFSDVYDILKKGIDNLVSVEKLSLLLHKSKEFSEVVSKFNSILDVPRLSEKEKQSIKHAVAGLKTCNDEELNWQGSYVAFQGHVSNACSEYEDVTSVVLSAMENISFGLRLAVSWRGSRQVTSVAEVVVVNVADAAISSALQYPFSSAITVNSKSSNGLLVQLRTQFVQSLNLSLSSVDVLVSRTETLCGSRSKPVVTTALLLQLLSKIDYFVGSKLVDPSQVSRIFHSILKKLQYFYASSEQERIKRQAEKDSMFKNRVKENTFISDDAEEETRDLRLNFPDHLAEFQSIVKSDVANEDIDGAGVADDESVEGAVEGVTEVADDCTSAFDFTTMSTDISSYHARMIFLHEQFDLATRGRCWSTANVHHRGINRVDSLGANSTVELMQSCIQRTLVVTKTLHGAIDHLSPSSFHVDPCKEEILHAAGPLNRLLKKASALLVEYPGNEILLQLCKLTARISQFHISTPLGKMLASIELLYREAHHWESYAAKHVSIIEEINGLGSLIARWREKELQSWEDLLRCKEQDYAVKAIQYWFTLSAVFDSVFALANVDDNQGREEESGVASLCISDAVELTAYSFSSWQSLSACSPAWLLDSISDNRKAAALAAESTGGREVKPADVSPQQKLFESLDGFLKGATVGEFPTRLHLVRLFALNLQQIYMRTKTNNATLLSSVNLAMNMWKFYDQFLSAVRGFQDILKSPIQKRIKDEIKISKWDQLSSYGLMEHSEKIHRKLNKIIREYQIDVLDYPVTSLLRKEAVGELAGENGDALQTDAVVIKNTSSALEGIDFGHCDETVFKQLSLLKQTDGFNGASVDSKLASVLLRYPRVSKVNSLLPKVHKSLKSLLLVNQEDIFDSQRELDTTFGRRYLKKCRFGYLSHELAEDMCSDIFGYMSGLQGEDVSRNQKQRALRDLLDALKERVGASQFHIDVPLEFKEAAEMLTAPVPLSTEISSDIFWDFSCPRDCLEKAETYFVKNVSEINELRTQAACEFSPDLSGRDVHAMTGYAENMLMRCFSIRGSTTALLSDIQVVTKESNALLETVRAVQDYRSEYMRIAKCDGDVLNSSTDASLITYALTFKRTVEEAWKYRKVAGSVLINSLSELEKLSGPALAALQQSDNVGSNADITSVFEDSHISRDVVGRVINDVSSLLSELHSAIYPKVDNIDYQAAPLLHATDVFGYEPSDGTSQEGGGACGVAQVKAALIDSESVITNCERRFANSRDVLCSILPPEVVEPIIAQFRAFVSTIRDQHEAFDALHSKTVDVLECSEGSTSRLDHGDTKVKDEYTERVVKIVQSSIDECLLSVQRLQFLSLSETSADEKKKSIKSFFGDRVINIPTFDEEDEFDVISCFELNSVGASALQLNKLAEMMRSLSTVFHSELHEFDFSIDMVNLFQSAALMVSSITLSSRILLEDMIRSYKSFSKMTYVCIRIFRNLIAKGFCTSSADTNMEDGEGSGEGTMTFEDDVDGTGMGEGDGKKDVSDEIENEEQLLGLKDDKPNEQNDSSEKKELDEKDKDTGVEMNQDFDGELYDIPEDENEEKQDDEEEDEEEDLDREMDHGGEFSYDNVVDEQQWGSDDDEDDDNHGNKEDNKEMFEEGNAMDSEALEGEMRTNDQDEAENKPGQDDKPEKNEDKGGDDQNDDEDMNGKVNDEDEADTMEKPMGVDVRKADEAKEDEQPTDEDGDDNADPADADMQDQTTGAFDDDQKDTLGGPQGDMQDDVAGGDDEDMDVENMSISNDSDNDDNESVKSESPDDVERNEPDGPDADAPAVQDGGEQDQELDLNEGDRKQKKKKSASSAAFGVQAQDGADAMQKDDSGGDGNAEKNDQQVAAGQASGQGSSTSGQNDPGMEDGAEKDPADVLDSAEPPDNSNESGGGGDNDTSGASNADAMSSGDGPPNNRHREPPNPFRKKGDLDKAWHERLNMKKQKQDGAGMDKTSNKETGASGPSSGVFEYEMNDGEDMELDDPTSGEQVLAETVEGDAMKLQNPAGGDEGEEVNVNEQEGGEEGNGEDGFNTKGRKRKKADHSSDNSEDEAAEPVDEKKYNGEFDDESAMDDIKDLNQFPDDEKSVGSAAEPDVLDFGGKILSGASLTGSAKRDDAADDMNCEDDLEQTGMVEFKETTVVPTSSSAAIWAHHKSIGDEASMNLCEQLRLVLEPNLAARLKGDYRTGKRINMRRVISYVASGFRRDKIWLRRTKLAKRDYQVMLMIDDSCSMGAAGPLAMTSLAIISSALSRLEVGDLAVCSFSDHVNMLHPFGSPFTDDSGAGVANSLKFNASQTLLAGALDSVIPVFDAARHGQMSNATGSGVVVQLCFLISDARLDTDNRERLNNVVRRMAEKHILVVLIILDQNEDSKDSIFNTKSIEFTDEGIVTRSYLDNFPFPFYVAIQKLSALPNVLADSLKQWFEYVQYSLDSNNN
ncbi:unnamed protein product, partial [Ectocarpus fasciculatus]